MADASPTLLPYAPPDARRAMCKIVLRTLALVTVLVALVAGYCQLRYRLPYWRWLADREGQFRALLAYTDAPAAVLYQDSLALPYGDCRRFPPDFAAFSLNCAKRHAVLFVHERRAGNVRRLVVVSYWNPTLVPAAAGEVPPGAPVPPRGELVISLFAPDLTAGNTHLVAPLTRIPFPTAARNPAYPALPAGPDAVAPTRTLAFTAGQPDPVNPARFTLPYTLNGQPHTLTAALAPDGQSVTLTDTP
jgi:hypothetical protein